MGMVRHKTRTFCFRSKNQHFRKSQFALYLGPRIASLEIWEVGWDWSGGWRLMPKFGTGRQLSKSEISSWSSCWWRLRSTNSTLEFGFEEGLELESFAMGIALPQNDQWNVPRPTIPRVSPRILAQPKAASFNCSGPVIFFPSFTCTSGKGCQEWKL